MTVKVNGTSLSTQPSDMGWVQRQSMGDDGNGHAIYPAPREFHMEWDIIDASSFNQVQGFYNAIGNTGTAVVTLPQYGSSTYQDYDYTGCVLQEPNYDRYFEQHYYGVKWLVVSIRNT